MKEEFIAGAILRILCDGRLGRVTTASNKPLFSLEADLEALKVHVLKLLPEFLFRQALSTCQQAVLGHPGSSALSTSQKQRWNKRSSSEQNMSHFSECRVEAKQTTRAYGNIVRDGVCRLHCEPSYARLVPQIYHLTEWPNLPFTLYDHSSKSTL